MIQLVMIQSSRYTSLQTWHLVMIHPSQSRGEPFKLLGLMMDLDLRMHLAIDQLLSKILAKSTAILRTRAYYSTPELVNQYKIHIWELVELHCGGYFHAAFSLLDKIDQVQRNFLNKLNVSEQEAFLNHNFAPSSLRRNLRSWVCCTSVYLGNVITVSMFCFYGILSVSRPLGVWPQ